MRKDLWRKGIVVGIIVLFFGAIALLSLNVINSKINVVKERIDMEE